MCKLSPYLYPTFFLRIHFQFSTCTSVIQGVSGGIVNILEDGSMDYSE